MAVENFIQSIWSKKIQDDLEVECKLVDNCLRSYEGDIKFAASVKILGVGEPNLFDYDGSTNINYEEMSDKGQMLVIDRAKGFGFLVDDINQAQSVPGLREEYQRKAVHGLAVNRDTYVANLIKTAAYKLTEDTTVTSGKVYYIKAGFVYAAVSSAAGNPKELGYYEKTGTEASNLTEEAVKAAIDAAIVALRERNFTEDGVIEISPAVYNVFKNCLITLSTNNPEYIKKGIVGVYDNFNVVMSNNMAKDDTHVYCCVRGKKAVAFAGQINEVEALRHPFLFKDIVRGLDTFGGKVIDEERIETIKVPLARVA